MSYMSRDNSSTSLMGFSVHQPALGAPLQFIPAMGSKQLDDMIDAYVPGNKSILDKRADVSVEFYQHVCQTGNMFKFFTVYPSMGSVGESPASSLLDSGYSSNFTSPIMSESQWTHASNNSFSSSGSQARNSSPKTATSTDFSHLPGMKIITKDGIDVTNSASRGCKTKEQRDHAHLMRIIKACDACRKKKVRCDPSHKKSASSSGAKASKKAKKAAISASRAAIAPQVTSEPLDQSLFTTSLDPTNSLDPASSFSFDSTMPESSFEPTMEWDQFFQFNEEPTDTVPFDYDFFYDPAGYFSSTSSNSLPSPQSVTPAQSMGVESVSVGTTNGIADGTAEGVARASLPLPPYFNPGGEAGNDYADFNLYSPGSSSSLDDDPSLIRDLAATSRPDFNESLSHQRLRDGYRRDDDYRRDGHMADDRTGNDYLTDDRSAVDRLASDRLTDGPAGMNNSYIYSTINDRTNIDRTTNNPSSDDRASNDRISVDRENAYSSGILAAEQSQALEVRIDRQGLVSQNQRLDSLPDSSIIATDQVSLSLQGRSPRTPLLQEPRQASLFAQEYSQEEPRQVAVFSQEELQQLSLFSGEISPGGGRGQVTSFSQEATKLTSLSSPEAPLEEPKRSPIPSPKSEHAPLFSQKISQEESGVLRSTPLGLLLSAAALVVAAMVVACLIELAPNTVSLRDTVVSSFCRGILANTAPKAAESISTSSASLFLTVAAAIFTHSLSFFTRHPTTIGRSTKSRNLKLFQKVSSIRSNFEGRSLPFNQTKNMASRLSYTTRSVFI